MRGRVEFFNNPKGWGVIKNEVGESFFVHHRDIEDSSFFPENGHEKFRTLRANQEVSFLIRETEKPLNMAVKVLIVDREDTVED